MTDASWVSPYIARLVEKERRERPASRDTTLERVIDWHQKRVGECLSAAVNPGRENNRTAKARLAMQMHDVTISYLKRLANKEIEP